MLLGFYEDVPMDSETVSTRMLGACKRRKAVLVPAYQEVVPEIFSWVWVARYYTRGLHDDNRMEVIECCVNGQHLWWHAWPRG